MAKIIGRKTVDTASAICEKETKKLERMNEVIAKKQAQIEKLEKEIYALERKYQNFQRTVEVSSIKKAAIFKATEIGTLKDESFLGHTTVYKVDGVWKKEVGREGDDGNIDWTLEEVE